MQLIDLVKKALPADKHTASGKDVKVFSKDRAKTKAAFEKYLKSKKVLFKSVFKASKSSSLEVISINGVGDVIFKPIIVKGAGGLSFEKELETDLNNYFNGAEGSEIKHNDVIDMLESVIGITRSPQYKVLHEGAKNQKRALVFTGSKVNITNSSGEYLTDITLMTPANKKLYLSLKMSNSYYVTSSSIYKYFLDKSTQIGINEYFGFNGQLMEGFGKEYGCLTLSPSYAKVKSNLEDLLNQAMGNNVIIIHKKRDRDVTVTKVGNSSKVSISNLSDTSYVYPEAGKRKYANIKVKAMINKHHYNVNFQFRGTTAADVGPKYLRILLERL